MKAFLARSLTVAASGSLGLGVWLATRQDPSSGRLLALAVALGGLRWLVSWIDPHDYVTDQTRDRLRGQVEAEAQLEDALGGPVTRKRPKDDGRPPSYRDELRRGE